MRGMSITKRCSEVANQDVVAFELANQHRLNIVLFYQASLWNLIKTASLLQSYCFSWNIQMHGQRVTQVKMSPLSGDFLSRSKDDGGSYKSVANLSSERLGIQ